MTPGVRQRLDERMLADGLTETRSRAQSLIRAGRVLVDDVPVDKPGTPIRDDAKVRIRGEDRRFVSRGGEKLAGALEDLGVDPNGRVCLDLGASTGGFTDCLLQSGARHVFALDVGYGQLDARLRADPRVTVMERSNARHLEAALLEPRPDLVVIDVSFISLTKVLPKAAELSAPLGVVIALVKPQFEVGKGEVGKGGIVRDPVKREGALNRVVRFAETMGFVLKGAMTSPITGQKGNIEYLICLVNP